MWVPSIGRDRGTRKAPHILECNTEETEGENAKLE